MAIASIKSTELQMLKGRFNFLVNQASAVITIVDRKGIILYQSPSIKHILGYDSQKRIGKNFLHSKLVHPKDVVIKEKLIDLAFHHENNNFQGELRMQHKDGTWHWMEVVFNNQLSNPSVGGIVVITHDITNRKRLEIQKNEFLSIVSHELKTPLTAIRAYAQIMSGHLKKKEHNEKEIIFLEKIISQTDRVTQLISDLLDIGKIEEGKLSIEMEPFQMKLLLEKILDDFTYIADLRNVQLSGNTKAFVLGDESRISQVVMNLLTNAMKYSPEESKIVIRVEKIGKEVITSVTDEGDGIAKDKQKYVFDRFYRIEEKKSRQTSSGLGLYIASEIIKLHNGKIWLKSTKGKGSTFYFSLPVAAK